MWINIKLQFKIMYLYLIQLDPGEKDVDDKIKKILENAQEYKLK